MTTLARQFGLVFFIGFFSLAVSLAYSVISAGVLFADHPLISALRALGLGMIAAGFTLWIVLRRNEAGREGMNSLFGFLLVGGVLFLLLGALFPSSGISRPAQIAGLAFMLSALGIGLLVTLIAPAYPRPIARRWPEGGEVAPMGHEGTASAAHGAGGGEH